MQTIKLNGPLPIRNASNTNEISQNSSMKQHEISSNSSAFMPDTTANSSQRLTLNPPEHSPDQHHKIRQTLNEVDTLLKSSEMVYYDSETGNRIVNADEKKLWFNANIMLVFATGRIFDRNDKEFLNEILTFFDNSNPQYLNAFYITYAYTSQIVKKLEALQAIDNGNYHIIMFVINYADDTETTVASKQKISANSSQNSANSSANSSALRNGTETKRNAGNTNGNCCDVTTSRSAKLSPEAIGIETLFTKVGICECLTEIDEIRDEMIRLLTTYGLVREISYVPTQQSNPHEERFKLMDEYNVINDDTINGVDMFKPRAKINRSTVNGLRGYPKRSKRSNTRDNTDTLHVNAENLVNYHVEDGVKGLISVPKYRTDSITEKQAIDAATAFTFDTGENDDVNGLLPTRN